MITTTVEIDTSKLNHLMVALAQASSPKTTAQIIKEEHARLVKTIVKFIPPIGAGAHQTGKKAVERELRNLITEAGSTLIDEVGSEHGIKNIDAYRTTKGGEGQLHIQWENIALQQQSIEQLHPGYRSQTTFHTPILRTQKGQWRARIATERGQRAIYIRKIQDHIGRWKAKWAYSAAALGTAKFPNWIAKHFGYVSKSARLQTNLEGEHPYIIFGAVGPNQNRIQQRIKDAVAARAKAIPTRIRHLIRLAAKGENPNNVASTEPPEPEQQ